MTLAEVLVASAIGLAVILSIGQVDMTRINIMNQVLRPATLSEAALGMHHMIKHLMQADRVVVLAPDNVQVRIPQNPAALDTPASYRWAQYKLVDGNGDTLPDTINFYDDTAAGCGVDAAFGGSVPASNVVTTMTLVVAYADEDSPMPPGGEPPMNDNNTVRITVAQTWAPPGGSPTTETNGGSVTLRAGAYSDLDAGIFHPGDSGTGLLTVEPVGGGPPPGC
jgi:hypothetical protein